MSPSQNSKKESSYNRKETAQPQKDNVIKTDSNYNRTKKLSLKGRVKKIPSTINYNELFLDTNKYDEKISNIGKDNNNSHNNNLDDFLSLVQKKEEYNKMFEDHNKQTNINKRVPQSTLPKSKQDLLFFDEPDNKFNFESNNHEIDYNLEFLKKNDNAKDVIVNKNIDGGDSNKEVIADDNESVRLINKLKNSGAFKIANVIQPAKK